MFTKGKFKKVNGDLVFQAIHAESGQVVEIIFSGITAYLIVGTEKWFLPKTAKLADCLAKLDKMAKKCGKSAIL